MLRLRVSADVRSSGGRLREGADGSEPRGVSLSDGGRFRFGVFDFNVATLELHKHDTHGVERPVRLRPQSLKLLKLLVERPGQLLTRDEINRQLWEGDVYVDFEQGVNHCVKQLRAALGDSADTPRFIETLPRRGYRFIAPVERVRDGPKPDSNTGLQKPLRDSGRLEGMSAWFVLAALLAVAAVLVVAAARSRASVPGLPAGAAVAVLPFNVLGLPPDRHYLGISLADAVIGRLSTSATMRVRPIVPTLTYDAGATEFSSIGQKLRVEYVVAGTVEQSGVSTRARLQLIHAATSRLVWSASVAAPSGDLIALENAVTDRVAAALNANLPSFVERARTEDVAAYEAYSEGRFYLARFTRDETLAAVAAFERALALDSKYPLAHAGLAKASALMFIRFGHESEIETWRTRSEQHARRALELEGTLAEAHEALAAVARYTEFDWDRTIEQSLEALRLNPNLDLPHYYLASALQHIGRLDMVEDEVITGLEVNPLNLAEAFRLRGMTALWSGRFNDARTHFERLRDLSSKSVSQQPLAQALFYAGEPAQAETLLSERGESAQSEQRLASMRASILAARGDRRAALELVDDVLSRKYRDHHVAYSLGATYAGLGRPVDALHWLREAGATGFLCYPWYSTDPLLQPLRAHAEFQAFLAEVKQRAERIDVGAIRDRQR